MEKEIKFEDTNIALIGSDLDKEIRKKKADAEPEWQKIPKQPCLLVWRIENFGIKPWPKNQYGSFFIGDSYIVLNIQKAGDSLEYTAHMWIGKQSTQDERGTAAIKTIELDDFFIGGVELIYEAQGDESDEFKALFPTIILMEGGVPAGWKDYGKETYEPRLLQIKKDGGKQATVTEVEKYFSNLNSDDAFVVDGGDEVYVWRGKGASGFEMLKANQTARAIKDSRNLKGSIPVLDEGDKGTLAIMEKYLKEKPEDQGKGNHGTKVLLRAGRRKKVEKLMFRLSDESGNLTLSKLDDCKPENLESKDAFLVDAGSKILVWVGKEASKDEKKFGLLYAQKYLKENKNVGNATIHVFKEGSKKIDISSYFN